MKPQSNNTPPTSKGVKKQSDERKSRLAKALRDNLMRRKAASRASSTRTNAQGE